VLPADILGQVYEQFSAKSFASRRAIRPRWRTNRGQEGGGVYYTPTYIVDYIVKNTVGKMLEGKTPKEISGETPKAPTPAHRRHRLRLRFVPPRAYQYLLTWYRDRYIEEGRRSGPREKNPGFIRPRRRMEAHHLRAQAHSPESYLRVDIDSQAVEVTKLSLLLKVLEGETKESVSIQRRLFHERALPDLSRNIKCGNSLIGSDFYKGEQSGLFGDDEERERSMRLIGRWSFQRFLADAKNL